MRPVRSGSSGSATGTPGYAQARVAVRQARPGTLRPEWQCRSHCQVASSVPQRYAQARVAVRPVRSGPSGSATGAPGYARGRVAVRITLPSGIERTATVRSDPSGSATGAFGYARGRVAVRVTLPLAGERAEAERSVPSGSAMGTLGVEWQCGPGPFVDLRALHRHGDDSPDGSPRVTRPSFTDQDSLLANQTDR